METTTMQLIGALVFVGLILWFIRLQYKITEPIELEAPEEKLPDESEDEPIEYHVGYVIEKNGFNVKVVQSKAGCKLCFLHDEYRTNSCLEKCMPCERKDGISIIFKKVTDGSEN